MIIEENDFKLTSIDDSSPFFDLELLFTIRPKGKESRQEFKTVAYGITLETALKKIVNHRISNKYENSINLSTYLKELKSEVESIKNLCKYDQ